LFLGRLRRPGREGDPPRIDESVARPYVELKASAVATPEGTARLAFAETDGPLAIYAGTDPAKLNRMFALAGDGTVTVTEGLIVDGALTVGAQLGFEPGQEQSGWALQLVSVPGNNASELRVQMGPASGSETRRTVIGVSGQDGSFMPLLTIGEDGT